MAHELRGFERCTLGSNHDFECDLCSQPTDLVESNGHFLAEIHQEPVSLLLSLEADSILRPQSSVSLSKLPKETSGGKGGRNTHVDFRTDALPLGLALNFSVVDPSTRVKELLAVLWAEDVLQLAQSTGSELADPRRLQRVGDLGKVQASSRMSSVSANPLVHTKVGRRRKANALYLGCFDRYPRDLLRPAGRETPGPPPTSNGSSPPAWPSASPADSTAYCSRSRSKLNARTHTLKDVSSHAQTRGEKKGED